MTVIIFALWITTIVMYGVPVIPANTDLSLSPLPHPLFVSDSGAPVYLYEFQHRPSALKNAKPDFVKADHGDELAFVFGMPFLGSESATLMGKNLIDVFFCFASIRQGKVQLHRRKSIRSEAFLKAGQDWLPL